MRFHVLIIGELIYFAMIGIGGFLVLFFATITILVYIPYIFGELNITFRGQSSDLNRWLPDRFFYTRNDPPWHSPRTVTTGSRRQEQADYNLLFKRLAFMAEQELGNADYFMNPILFLDEETGQYWLNTEEEIGWGQWKQLKPVEPPKPSNNSGAIK